MKSFIQYIKEAAELDEGLYHVSYGLGLDHQVVAKDATDAHKKAMAHFKKTKPKLNDPKYADTFDKKSITRVKGDEPRSDKYKTEEIEQIDEISTEKLRDYAGKALQDKNKAKSDKRWKYGSKATDIVGDRDTKAAHDLKFNKTEEVELDEEQKPAYHYYATKNGIGAKEMKLTHSKSKPFTSETDALKHIGNKNGIIHKVNSVTGKVVQHRGIDGGQKGYPTPASDMPGDAPKHVRDLKEEVELDEAGRHLDYVPRKSSNTEVDVKGMKVPIKKHSWGDWEVPHGPHKDIGQHKSKESLVNALHTRIKEEVEQIGETSKKLAKSYLDKSAAEREANPQYSTREKFRSRMIGGATADAKLKGRVEQPYKFGQAPKRKMYVKVAATNEETDLD